MRLEVEVRLWVQGQQLGQHRDPTLSPAWGHTSHLPPDRKSSTQPRILCAPPARHGPSTKPRCHDGGAAPREAACPPPTIYTISSDVWPWFLRESALHLKKIPGRTEGCLKAAMGVSDSGFVPRFWHLSVLPQVPGFSTCERCFFLWLWPP